MHKNKRSLLDYTPAEPRQNNHAYASENTHLGQYGANTQPEQKNGLKKLADVFSVRQKRQENVTSGENRNQQDIVDHPDHVHTSSRERSSQNTPDQQEYYHDPDKPLLDFVAIVMSVWQRKYLITVLALIGGVIGVLVALSTPHKYYAESQIFLDPRELRLTDTDLSNNPVSSELLLALVDTQMRVATSTTVLENTIDELGLVNDPEFSGNDGGIGKTIKELFLGSSSTSTNINKRVLDQLRKSIGIGRDPKTLVVSLGVTTLNAEKSALIANSIVEQFLKEFNLQKSEFFTQTSSSIQDRLGMLRARLDEAENAIVRYRSTNDIIDVGGGVINQKEMLSLSDSLTKIRAEQIAKSILAQELAKVDVNAVISGSFPQAALTDTLSEQRKQYSVAKSTSDSLAVGLGARHPQLVAAQASVKALGADIRDELRRIIAAAQRDAKRTQQSEAELSSQLAVLKSKSSDLSVENIELEELTRKASSLRVLYEQLLKSSSEIAVQSELSSSKIQIISEAEAPDFPSTTSRKITVILFVFVGAIFGIFYAMVIGAWKGIQQNYTSQLPAKRRSTVPQENASDSRYDQNPPPEAVAHHQRHHEPAKQTPTHTAHNHGYAVNGIYGHAQNQAQGQVQEQAYSPIPMSQAHMHAHPQDYVDPRIVPVAGYAAPMPQTVFINDQPSPIYQNIVPNPAQHPAATQHAYIQPAEQVTRQSIVEPHVQRGQPQAQENSGVADASSVEYQRLHNEVQRIREELESWVHQNNRDANRR